ncbi:MAG: F0F1 ATP synthase subunit A [Patescibacteria group bacterium]
MHEISIKAEELFRIGSFPVSNSLVLAIVSLGVILLFAIILRNRIALVPRTLQSVFEIITEQILLTMDAVLGKRSLSIYYFPFIASMFLFLLVSNWLGLFPVVGSFEFHHKPLFRAPAADLNFTFALAIISVFATQVLGVLALGIRRHASKYFTFKNPIFTFVGLLELVSEFAKIISFSFRLFGNVFAGEVLLIIIGFLVPYILPLPFLFLEVFVGFMQAFIFSMLTLVFIGMAVTEEPAH